MEASAWALPPLARLSGWRRLHSRGQRGLGDKGLLACEQHRAGRGGCKEGRVGSLTTGPAVPGEAARGGDAPACARETERGGCPHPGLPELSATATATSRRWGPSARGLVKVGVRATVGVSGARGMGRLARVWEEHSGTSILRSHSTHVTFVFARAWSLGNMSARGPRILFPTGRRTPGSGRSARGGAPPAPPTPSCCRGGARPPPPAAAFVFTPLKQKEGRVPEQGSARDDPRGRGRGCGSGIPKGFETWHALATRA